MVSCQPIEFEVEDNMAPATGPAASPFGKVLLSPHSPRLSSTQNKLSDKITFALS